MYRHLVELFQVLILYALVMKCSIQNALFFGLFTDNFTNLVLSEMADGEMFFFVLV